MALKKIAVGQLLESTSGSQFEVVKLDLETNIPICTVVVSTSCDEDEQIVRRWGRDGWWFKTNGESCNSIKDFAGGLDERPVFQLDYTLVPLPHAASRSDDMHNGKRCQLVHIGNEVATSTIEAMPTREHFAILFVDSCGNLAYTSCASKQEWIEVAESMQNNGVVYRAVSINPASPTTSFGLTFAD